MNSNTKGARNDLRTAALEYAHKHIPVFPLNRLDKTPILKGGFHNASCDPVSIKAHWGNHPNANIGMPTGTKSGIIVIDVDNKNANGFESLKLGRRCTGRFQQPVKSQPPTAAFTSTSSIPALTLRTVPESSPASMFVETAAM
jgi:hypothetical protein